jgi:thymidylate synthase
MDKKYQQLLQKIKDEGTLKPAARANMPGTISLFGAQIRHDLSEGFPLLTTKKLSMKNIVTELLWFLRGDTNIKYLVDNGCNIWNEDAYNYYKKFASINTNDISQNDILFDNTDGTLRMLTFDEFVEVIKKYNKGTFPVWRGYTLGDCGFQYGRVWRGWEGPMNLSGKNFVLAATNDDMEFYSTGSVEMIFNREVLRSTTKIDQIANIINGLKKNPESRRHILTAIDPAHENDLALYWCHALAQFNCRPITPNEQLQWLVKNGKAVKISWETIPEGVEIHESVGMQAKYAVDKKEFENAPKYYLDCQLYQRSADVFLGVPYNIASYSLLTHIFAKICNMIPGEFIHTFGDVHIYENHMDAVNEQLIRIPRELPKLVHMKTDAFWNEFDISQFNHLDYGDFMVQEYNPHPIIKAELSTGLIK